MQSFLEANRVNWDERADIHVEDTTGAYAIERFLAGEDVLYPIEAAEIGDVAGLDVLHLQCHIGLDTLCLARRGARATGLDFSATAIGHARGFAERTGLQAHFVEGEVYDAPHLVGEGRFDLVYTTWGTITWLPSITLWADTIARLLRPGGRLYFADTHPVIATLEEVDGRIVPTFNWRTPASVPIASTVATTYTGDPRPLQNSQNFEWLHPVSDTLMALIGAGLAIERIAEHEALPYALFPMMKLHPDRLYRLPPGMPRLPLAISLVARKAA
jgi:2-polyprenyl-3-methyl-5-hydroxy-6-metoxy-1,4-benzoquinol methylase